MHEVGLMQEAMRIASERAQAVGASRIHAVTLNVGALSGVECETLRLAFEIVAADFCAQGASLLIVKIPTRCWCKKCERPFEPAGDVFRCPVCRQISSDVRQGREFELASVEVS